MDDKEIIIEFESMLRWWQADAERHRKKAADADKEIAKCKRILDALKKTADEKQ